MDTDKEIHFESKLLRKANDGDIASFEKLIVKYEKLVYNIAYRMFGNPEDARDIAQEVFVKVYKNIGKCKDPKHFKNWICIITNNTCIDELRKRKGKTTESIDEKIASEEGLLDKQISSTVKTPEQAYLDKEMRGILQTAINSLPHEQKTLIVLRDIQGFSYQELAEVTGSALGTVKSRLARARVSLKDLVTKTMEQKKR